ncbi:MAG TPA: CDP-diacylglycerol--serine O-phosphatidyltransferase [Bryobacteraceae bacterium]|jgi:CDP-diacylglycerol--serine O-phosphatidyltransferase
MKTLRLRERLIDPRSPDRRPRRAAYALPTLFTAGNVFLGFYALLEVFQGAMQAVENVAGAQAHFQWAALAIGLAVFLDGLDGRIARMTNTVSDFGREMDSLADVITFGIAPAVLAFAWGIEFVEPPSNLITLDQLRNAGYFVSFVFLLCGALRLARFNIQKNPVLRNPGRPDRKYFAGLPIPAAAAMVAGVVYGFGSTPLHWWVFSAAWVALLGVLSFLMVSTWRYPSFKDIDLLRPRTPLTFVLLASLIALIVNFSRPALLLLPASYVATGIVIRIAGALRRRFRPASLRWKGPTLDGPERKPGSERKVG